MKSVGTHCVLRINIEDVHATYKGLVKLFFAHILGNDTNEYQVIFQYQCSSGMERTNSRLKRNAVAMPTVSANVSRKGFYRKVMTIFTKMKQLHTAMTSVSIDFLLDIHVAPLLYILTQENFDKQPNQPALLDNMIKTLLINEEFGNLGNSSINGVLSNTLQSFHIVYYFVLTYKAYHSVFKGHTATNEKNCSYQPTQKLRNIRLRSLERDFQLCFQNRQRSNVNLDQSTTCIYSIYIVFPLGTDKLASVIDQCGHKHGLVRSEHMLVSIVMIEATLAPLPSAPLLTADTHAVPGSTIWYVNATLPYGGDIERIMSAKNKLILCMYYTGSFLNRPAVFVCHFHRQYANATLDSTEVLMLTLETICQDSDVPDHVYSDPYLSHHMETSEASSHLCYSDSEYKHMWRAWLATNINYGITVTCMGINIFQISYLYVCKSRNYVFMLGIGSLNQVWLAWRLQESVNWYTHWRERFSYVCHITSLIRLCVEAMSIYMLSLVSFDRFLAIVFPLFHLANAKKVKKMKICCVGFTVGLVSSILRSAVLLLMKEPRTGQVCEIQNPGEESMLFFFVSTMLSMIVMYAFPCILMIVLNTATAIRVIHSYYTTDRLQTSSSTHQHPSTKTMMTIVAIIASSVFLSASLLEPAHYLMLAWELYRDSIEVISRYEEIFYEAVTSNILALAYSFNMFGLYARK